MAKRINTSTFVEVINEGGDERYVINKDRITYISGIDKDKGCVNFVDKSYLGLDKRQMKQLFESIENYT